MRIALSTRWLIGLACILVIGGAGSAAAVAMTAHPVVPSGRAHDKAIVQARTVPGGFISRATAQTRALAAAAPMGTGARVLTARLLTVKAASAAAGQRVASDLTSATRMVWLVWMRGPWRVLNCINVGMCPAKPHQVYYVSLDATTGISYGMGWSRSYQTGAAL